MAKGVLLLLLLLRGQMELGRMPSLVASSNHTLPANGFACWRRPCGVTWYYSTLVTLIFKFSFLFNIRIGLGLQSAKKTWKYFDHHRLLFVELDLFCVHIYEFDNKKSVIILKVANICIWIIECIFHQIKSWDPLFSLLYSVYDAVYDAFLIKRCFLSIS